MSSLEQTSGKHSGQRNGVTPATAPLQICRPGLGDKGLSALCLAGISTPTFHLFAIEREVTAKAGAVAASLVGHSSLVLANCGVTGLVNGIVFAIMSPSAPP